MTIPVLQITVCSTLNSLCLFKVEHIFFKLVKSAFFPNIGIHGKPRKQRDFQHTGAQHDMGKPDSGIPDVPELKFSGGVQDACLQSHARCRQNTVKPDTDFLGQDHVKDNRQKAEQKSGGDTGRYVFHPCGEKQGKADNRQQAEKSGNGDKQLQLPDAHIRQADCRVQHLHGGSCAFPAPEAV